MLIMLQLQQLGPEASRFLNHLDGIFYDIRFRATIDQRPVFPEPKIAIIDIDEKSLQREGQWPWNRRKIADLTYKLLDAGVVVIAFDVVFAEPEENPIAAVISELGNEVPHVIELQKYSSQIDGDLQLAKALQAGDVVLGSFFEQQNGVSKGTLPESTITIVDRIPVTKTKALPFSSFIGNIDVLQQQAMGQGFYNSVPDVDGSIRRAALLIQHQGQLYPALALEAARLYSLADTVKVDVIADGHFFNITGLTINDRTIATDEHGRVLVPYRGGRASYPYYSATDILNGQIEPGVLTDAIVFVGTSSVGLVDLRETPVGIQYPGVEVHANVLEGLLNPEIFHYQHDLADAFIVFYLIIFGVLMSYLFPKLDAPNMAIWGCVLLLGTVVINSYFWTAELASLPLTTPILLCLLITVINILFGFFAESNQKKIIKDMFDQYVPPAHIEQMLNQPSRISLAGDRKMMSVLFADIRDFTSISEGLAPNELKELLNSYFSPVTKTILDNQGTIDKYVGDMVMAFWGAPLDDENHASHAIYAAFSMLNITDQLSVQFEEQGWSGLKVGIGINSGYMNVGDMGSEFRRAYTVLGDAVNLGSRLEGLTKFYKVNLLVSEYSKQQAEDDFEFKLIDKVRVKGKEQVVSIYQPLALKGQLSEDERLELELYQVFYTYYMAQEWQKAELAINHLLKAYPNCDLYKIYAERIQHLKTEIKQKNWDGSFTHQYK